MAERTRKTDKDRHAEHVAPRTAARRVPPSSSIGRLLALQQTAGNRAVNRLVAQAQAKLEVGPAGDRHEREADAVAAEVVRALRSGPQHDEASTSKDAFGSAEVQRAPVEAEVGFAGGELDSSAERAVNAARQGGSPLPDAPRTRMEGAFGADFSRVRIHEGSAATQLNDAIQARAFTIGPDIFFRGGAPSTSTPAGQELLAHELTHTIQQGAATARREVAGISRRSPAIMRYDDIPVSATWKLDSTVKGNTRPKEVTRIDDALDAFATAKGTGDTATKLSALRDVKNAIYSWDTQLTTTEKKKEKKKMNAELSARKSIVDELRQIVDTKIQELSDARAVELAPLATQYRAAARKHNFKTTFAKGTELHQKHGEFFQLEARAALAEAKTTDMVAWATVFFAAPRAAVGGGSLTSLSLKAIADFSWLKKGMADRAINDFLLPNSTDVGRNHVMAILQHRPFRAALKAAATPAAYQQLEDNMPLLRIGLESETKMASDGIDVADIDALAKTVFEAFLNDLPISNLIYSTVSGEFSLVDYLLGNADAKIGAPCMVLSSIFNELFKMVIPNPPPVIPGGDNRPLLTKRLADIGKDAVLTREASFKGNVERYGKTTGYDTINRIFFGDGHIWLEINNIEYDPTLGIMGPNGTVAKAVEKFFAVKGKDKFKSADGQTATKNKHVPPGGPRLNFDRSVVIK
ncbi:MAG: DUF4157 domain-containing protein [Acidimicrobiales bacterium]